MSHTLICRSAPPLTTWVETNGDREPNALRVPGTHVAQRNFGTLEVHVLNEYHKAAHPEIFELSNIGPDGKPNAVHPDRGTLFWHSDASFQRSPALATLLYAERVPRSGGHTMFADMIGAYLREAHELPGRAAATAASSGSISSCTFTVEVAVKTASAIYPRPFTLPLSGMTSPALPMNCLPKTCH